MKEKKRPAFISTLMSCGGGKGGRAAAEMDSGQRPTDKPKGQQIAGNTEIMENMDTEVRNASKYLYSLFRDFLNKFFNSLSEFNSNFI